MALVRVNPHEKLGYPSGVLSPGLESSELSSPLDHLGSWGLGGEHVLARVQGKRNFVHVGRPEEQPDHVGLTR